ncbi:hypothetical protein ACLOJK_036594 [Asimina triloba]
MDLLATGDHDWMVLFGFGAALFEMAMATICKHGNEARYPPMDWLGMKTDAHMLPDMLSLAIDLLKRMEIAAVYWVWAAGKSCQWVANLAWKGRCHARRQLLLVEVGSVLGWKTGSDGFCLPGDGDLGLDVFRGKEDLGQRWMEERLLLPSRICHGSVIIWIADLRAAMEMMRTGDADDGGADFHGRSLGGRWSTEWCTPAVY